MCGECIHKCPENNALRLTFCGKDIYPLDEEAAYQQEHSQKAGKGVAGPPAAQGGGKHLVGANVAEIAAHEYKARSPFRCSAAPSIWIRRWNQAATRCLTR